MRTVEELQKKIAETIQLLDEQRMAMNAVADKLQAATDPLKKLELAGEYQLTAVRQSFTCGLLAGLYHALGYSNDEIKKLLGDVEFTGFQ